MGALIAGWTLDAACAFADPGLFHGPDDETDAVRVAREREAKAVCARCPVRSGCLADALNRGDRFGVWGGTDAGERADIRRRRADAVRRASRAAAVTGRRAAA